MHAAQQHGCVVCSTVCCWPPSVVRRRGGLRTRDASVELSGKPATMAAWPQAGRVMPGHAGVVVDGGKDGVANVNVDGVCGCGCARGLARVWRPSLPAAVALTAATTCLQGMCSSGAANAPPFCGGALPSAHAAPPRVPPTGAVSPHTLCDVACLCAQARARGPPSKVHPCGCRRGSAHGHTRCRSHRAASASGRT